MDKPKLIDNIVTKERDGLFLFINPDKPSWFFGKKDALQVIKKCDGKNTIQDIIELLIKETGEDREDLEKTVPEFIHGIEKIGFIEGKEKPKKRRSYSFYLNFVILHVTHRCNLKCSYCYITAGKPLENELSTEEIFSIIDQMKELGMGKQQVDVSGGEPLLREDIWEIARYMKKQGIIPLLLTNGTLIDREMAKKIKECFDAVQISLDGLREVNDKYRGKGTFDRVINAIENLVEVGVTPGIASVVTKENLGDVPKLLGLAKKYNLKRFKAGPLVPVGRGDERLVLSNREYIKLMRDLAREVKRLGLDDVAIDSEKFLEWTLSLPRREYSCGAAINMVSIDSDGSVYPCPPTHKEFFKAGNIRDRSLKEIWENSKVFKKWRETTVDTIPECSECEWRLFCGGACRNNAYMRHGTIRAPDIYCEGYATLIEDSLWEYGQREMEKKLRALSR